MIAVLGASGGTGRELVRQGLGRGHDVVALVRLLDLAGLDPHPRLSLVEADVRRPETVTAAVAGAEAVLSGLGGRDVLADGARAVLAARPGRVVWLGAFGTGRSAPYAGRLTRAVLALALRGELEDKAAADGLVLDAGHTVLHAGPLTDGAAVPAEAVAVSAAERRWFPRSVSRASVAAVMLDSIAGPPGLLTIR